jgi:hypothetical protein
MLSTLLIADSVKKFNENHDEKGQFASGAGGGEKGNREEVSRQANTASSDARAQSKSAAAGDKDRNVNPTAKGNSAMFAVTRHMIAASEHRQAAELHHTASGLYRYPSSTKLVNTARADQHTKQANQHNDKADWHEARAQAIMDKQYGKKS